MNLPAQWPRASRRDFSGRPCSAALANYFASQDSLALKNVSAVLHFPADAMAASPRERRPRGPAPPAPRWLERRWTAGACTTSRRPPTAGQPLQSRRQKGPCSNCGKRSRLNDRRGRAEAHCRMKEPATRRQLLLAQRRAVRWQFLRSWAVPRFALVFLFRRAPRSRQVQPRCGPEAPARRESSVPRHRARISVSARRFSRAPPALSKRDPAPESRRIPRPSPQVQQASSFRRPEGLESFARAWRREWELPP